MKRKNYLLAAAVIVSLAVFAGCGGKGKDSAGGTKTDTEGGTGEADADKAGTGEGTQAVESGDYSVDDYVTLGDYKGMEVEYIIPEVLDDDVEMYIQGELEENTEYKEITDRPAQEGDLVNIDFTGKIDGEEFDGGSAEEYELVLGSGEFLEDFEKNLVGKNAGETVTFQTTFPEDYDEEVGGKEAEFTVTIHSISEVITPEYNDDYVASVSEYKTTAEYEAKMKEELLASEKENALQEAGQSALAQAMENATVNGYPQDLYDTIYSETEENYKLFAEFMGMEYEDFLAEYVGTDDLSDEVLEQVNEILVVEAIAKKEGLGLKDGDYESGAMKLAEAEGYDSLESYEEDYGKDYVQRQLLHNQVTDFLYQSAKVTEVTQDEAGEGEELELEDGGLEDEEGLEDDAEGEAEG